MRGGCVRRWPWLALALAAVMGYFHLLARPAYETARFEQPAHNRASQGIITLVPLDGRPPCRDFVMALGEIAGYEVSVPPGACQDYYSQPGDVRAMRVWLRQNISGSKAAIISVDQLLSGGLMASREYTVTPGAVEELIRFLRELKEQNPQVTLYAFSILPRFSPPNSIDGYEERRDLMAYSRLVGEAESGGAVDDTALAELRERIPPASLAKYLALFEGNALLARKLALLAKEGVLDFLVLGQDDGERYGIPNLEKKRLREFLAQNEITEKQVFLTHGADEIALNLLAAICAKEAGVTPRVCIEYNDPSVPALVMPFMAADMATTAAEKVRLLSGAVVSSPEEADFTLFISATGSDTLSARRRSYERLRELAEAVSPVALVDLSVHFAGHETLLPVLLKRDFPLKNLTAYAGWNTASNAIGTALSQATVALSSGAVGRNRAFLHSRIMEDYFYLKDVIDPVNNSLKKAGFTNTNDLDLEHNFRYATYSLQAAMEERRAYYTSTRAFRQAQPALALEVWFPWPRTFEVRLTAR